MRVRTPIEAASEVRSRDQLALPLGPGQPGAFLHALGEREQFEDLQIFSALLLDYYRLFERPGVHLRSGFYGPIERALVAAGRDVHFVPADFRHFAPIVERLAARVMATSTALPDADGRLSLSLHAGATVEALRRCGRDPDRLLIVEANARLPRTFGIPPEYTHSLEVGEVDVLIEVDREVFALPEPAIGAKERAIAEHAARFISREATLQTGIGAIPSAVAALLAERSGGAYGIHSEMFTGGLMELHRAGKVANRKGSYDGVSIATFALGSRALYDWLHEQSDVRFLPVDRVNSSAAVAANRDFVSINGALGVDLAGQVAADTLDGRQFSGIGGHEDFVAGATLAEHGRSLICLPATAGKGASRVSRIAVRLAEGTLVTTPRHQVDVVITEYGAAELAGLTVEERARALAAVAHPEFRVELLRGLDLL